MRQQELPINVSQDEAQLISMSMEQSSPANSRLQHLVCWFDDLQLVVDALRPDNDLLTFRRQVEDLLNDERIRPFRSQAVGERYEGQGQEDYDR